MPTYINFVENTENGHAVQAARSDATKEPPMNRLKCP